MELYQIIVAIVAGICTSIPLIIKLIQQIQVAANQKNWQPIMELTMDLMKTAETKMEEGADRKEYVLAMVRVAAEKNGYTYDEEAISNMIDAMCNLTKEINVEE